MSEYKCTKCLICFRRKDYLQKHFKRKFPCKEAVLQNDTKMIPNDTKMIPNDTNIIPTVYKCLFCFEEFNNKRSLYRHKNELRCKEMPRKEVLKIKKFKNNKIIKKKLEQEKQLALQLNNSPNTSANTSTISNTSNTSNTVINNTSIIDNSNNNITKNNIINNFNFKIK